MSMKITIQAEQTVKYNADITVELPEGMTEDDFDSVVDNISERVGFEGSFDDVVYQLKKFNINVIENISDYPDSPSDSEVEIFSYFSVLEDERPCTDD